MLHVVDATLLVVIVILLLGNYIYQSDTRLTFSLQPGLPSVHCQDCLPATKANCESCPVDCHECSSCRPNCDLCPTDCFKCKTGPCQPSCEDCLRSSLPPDCTKCSQSCSLDCSRLKECSLSFKDCKLVAEGLSFDLVSHATLKRNLSFRSCTLEVISASDKGHIFTLENSNNIISVFATDRLLQVNANLQGEKVTFKTLQSHFPEHGRFQILKPFQLGLTLYQRSITVHLDSHQFSGPTLTRQIDPSERFSLHLGGLPGDLRARAYFTEDPYVGFQGCLSGLQVDGSLLDTRDFFLQGAAVGCPRKFRAVQK